MDGQCDKLVMVFGHQFITLTVYMCVQQGGRKALRRAGLSAAAETCNCYAASPDSMISSLIYKVTNTTYITN